MTTGRQRTYLTPAQENLLLIVSFTIITLIGFESLAVTTAMPTVVADLDGRTMYALAMGIPMATQLITIALAGPWSDSLGAKSCLFTGMGLFSLGLAIATFSPTMPLFVAGRAIQGLGGGLSIVPLYALIGAHIHPLRQQRFFAAFSAAWILPSLIGPAISGFVVSQWSWRWVFGAVPAIILLSSPLIIITIGKLPSHSSPFDWRTVKRNFLPALIAGVAIGFLEIVSGKNSSPTFVGAAMILGAGFLSLIAVRPLLPTGTLRSRRGLASTILTRGAINGSFLGVEAYLPLLLHDVHDWSALQSGFILTIGSLTWALGTWIQSHITDMHTRNKLPVAGSLIQFLGIALTIPGAFAHISGSFVIVGWLIAGLGCGLAYPGLATHALALTPLERQGESSSALQLSDTFGAALSIAMMGVIFAILQPRVSLPFAAVLALMAIVQFGAIIASTRTQPVSGSTEEAQLRETYAPHKKVNE